MVKLQSSGGNYLVAASQNRDELKVFQLKRNVSNIKLQPNDISAEIKFKDGKIQKQEFYYGSSFLSQSGRFLITDKNMISVTIKNSLGQIRSTPLSP